MTRIKLETQYEIVGISCCGFLSFEQSIAAYTRVMGTLCICVLAVVWIAQWLDWQAGLEHPSLRIRVSH